MERFAGWVRRALSVPTALVSLVQAEQQVFPGLAGLPEPFATARATPLTHSFCQHVIASAEPLVIGDARTDPLVRDNLAVPELGVVAYAGVPLTDAGGAVLGSLCAIDGRPRAWSDDELATLHDIARCCSTELRLRLSGHDTEVEGRRRDREARAQRYALEQRDSVAHAMQDAMRTDLPVVDGVRMAARYAPADARENVGGDWYDALLLGDPDDPTRPDLVVSVGDVVGHDLAAVTTMGQVRSMLRQATWDRAGRPPSATVHAFETANRAFDLGAAGTTVVAHLSRPGAPGDGWRLRWTNAGHPAPVLVRPDGSTELLVEHDPLFGFEFTSEWVRTDQARDVEPGAVLVLYSDGLVDHPGVDADAHLDTVCAVLRAVCRGTPDEIVDAVMRCVPDDARDDVVVFAIRLGDRAV